LGRFHSVPGVGQLVEERSLVVLEKELEDPAHCCQSQCKCVTAPL